jgi:amidase
MTDDLWKLSATRLASRIARREVTARQATESVLARIQAVNPRLHALATVTPEPALRAADAADAALQRGEPPGPLHGVPVTIKINVDVEGEPTTDGVAALAGNIARSDSPLVQCSPCAMPGPSSSAAATHRRSRCAGSPTTPTTGAR